VDRTFWLGLSMGQWIGCEELEEGIDADPYKTMAISTKRVKWRFGVCQDPLRDDSAFQHQVSGFLQI
jgi:hypothetical protein